MYFKYHKQMDVRKILYKNTLYNENGISPSVSQCVMSQGSFSLSLSVIHHIELGSSSIFQSI